MLKSYGCVLVVLTIETEMCTFCKRTALGEFICVLEVWDGSELILDFGGVSGDGCETAG